MSGAPPPGEPWTATRVLLRLEEAARTLRRLPPVRRRARLTSWPDVVRRAAPPASPGALRLAARPEAIDRMDETLVWLAWLPEATARIAWARANGATWSDVAALAGLGRRTCQRRLLEGLLAVARRLGRNPPLSERRRLPLSHGVGEGRGGG